MRLFYVASPHIWGDDAFRHLQRCRRAVSVLLHLQFNPFIFILPRTQIEECGVNIKKHSFYSSCSSSFDAAHFKSSTKQKSNRRGKNSRCPWRPTVIMFTVMLGGRNVIANTINLRLANDLKKPTVVLIKIHFNGDQSGSNCTLIKWHPDNRGEAPAAGLGQSRVGDFNCCRIKVILSQRSSRHRHRRGSQTPTTSVSPWQEDGSMRLDQDSPEGSGMK